MLGQSHEKSQEIAPSVYIIGHDSEVANKIDTWLKEIGLKAIKQETATTWIEEGAPFAEDVLDKIFELAKAVIFLLTGEEEVRLREDFRQSKDKDSKKESWLQPNQDQFFEAGYVFARYQKRVFLVQSGHVQPLSDIAGRFIYDFENSDHRHALRDHLQKITDRPNKVEDTDVNSSVAHETNNVSTNPVHIKVPNPKRVFVVFGRNTFIAYEVRAFLREIGLSPILWGQALKDTGSGSPPTPKILEAGFSGAQAVIVLLTGDDLARVKSQSPGTQHSSNVVSQPRSNVLFEAGMAFGSKRLKDKTILVEFEFDELRLGSYISDHHRLKLNNNTDRREEFIRRLRTVGCPVDHKQKKWHSKGNFSFSYRT
jgi:predicted nucleotide-binding protein